MSDCVLQLVVINLINRAVHARHAEDVKLIFRMACVDRATRTAAFTGHRTFRVPLKEGPSAFDDVALRSLVNMSAATLEEMDVSGCFHIRDLISIAECFKLRTLNISSCYFTDLSPLSRFEQLDHVILRGEWIDDKVMYQLSQCPRLRTLDLGGCFYHEPFDAFLGLTSFTQLHTLDLTNCHEFSDLSLLVSCKDVLRTLRLYGCADMTDLGPLVELSVLENLSIGGTGKRGSNIDDLEPLGRCSQLRSLSIMHCSKVTNLAPLAMCPVLEKLEIGVCPSIADVGPLAMSQSLRTLSICRCTMITDIGPLARCPVLEKLEIRG